ncbi:MAG: hypothetical protein WC781_02400 [Candidatus Pacearchaeota archaeon]|jgi:hypothetical protein
MENIMRFNQSNFKEINNQIPRIPHLRWNLIPSKDYNEGVKWFFLILSYPREISVYTSRIYQQLKPIMKHNESDGDVLESKLVYRLITLETPKGEVDFNKIYCGKRVRDERLYDRQQRDGLEDYISNQLG